MFDTKFSHRPMFDLKFATVQCMTPNFRLSLSLRPDITAMVDWA